MNQLIVAKDRSNAWWTTTIVAFLSLSGQTEACQSVFTGKTFLFNGGVLKLVFVKHA